MFEPDEIELAIIAGAVAALRKRAAVQRQKAAGAPGPGEAYIHGRLATVLAEIADEIEGDGGGNAA